jgi:hypothetical protein
MSWNKITLYKFQKIEQINKQGIEDLDKVLWSVCFAFDYTEKQLDELSIKKVDKLAAKMTAIFNSELKPSPVKRIGKYFINYDISSFTLGQYIELAFFLQQPIQHAHYILASVSNTLWRKNNAGHHRRKANYFLTQPITKVTGTVSQVVDNYNSFNKEYQWLFGLDKEVNGDVQEDKFNKQHGWVYSATQIAEHERISLEQAMSLPIRQAFNDLAYLKALGKYQDEQIKKQSNGR